MKDQDRDKRALAAKLARTLYEGRITWVQFMDQVPDTEDDDVTDLVDLIEHEPKKGGFLGVSATTHAEYMKQIEFLIVKLEGK